MKTEICETTLETINVKKYCGQTSNKAGNIVRTVERIGVFREKKNKRYGSILHLFEGLS